MDIRKKALVDLNFPSSEIIEEFLKVPSEIPNISKDWKSPNIVSFVRNSGRLLEWPEIYCFEKFLPLVTRWQIKHGQAKELLEPDFIVKKRVLKGIPSLEVVWKDTKNSFNGLICDEELKSYMEEHPKGLEELYSTIEPLDLMEKKYPDLVAMFLLSKEKPLKPKRKTKKAQKASSLENLETLLKATDEISKGLKSKKSAKKTDSSLNDMSDLLKATEEIESNIKPKKVVRKRKATIKNQLIDNFLIKNKENTPIKNSTNVNPRICSTPKNMEIPSDFESDCDQMDMSDIIRGILNTKTNPTKVDGKNLRYEEVNYSRDDLDLNLSLKETKRRLTMSFLNSVSTPKRRPLDDSSIGLNSSKPITLVDKFIEKETGRRSKGRKSLENKLKEDGNVSYFFDHQNPDEPDEFEKSLDFKKYSYAEDDDNEDDVIFICDD